MKDRIRHDARGLLMLIFFVFLRALCRIVIRHNARGLLGMKFKKFSIEHCVNYQRSRAMLLKKLTEVTLEAP
jgi:hypothetical protein